MSNNSTQIDGVSRRRVLQTGAVTLGTLGVAMPAAAGGSGVSTETQDIFGQGGGGPVVAEDGATIRRTKNGISMKVSMPTPEPGTYTYPGSGVFSGPGRPEGFTLWAFTFNDPDACDGECGGDDLGPSAGGGAYFVAGHMVDGPNLTLGGRVSKGSELFRGSPLSDPMGAAVHLAVAPHGALDPDKMPAQIKTPTGPGPDIWWLALFE